MDKLLVYIGTYTNNKGKGIYLYEMNQKTGALSLKSVAPSNNPSFLCISPNEKYLYAANEIGDYQGTKNGSVSAFSITPDSGELLPLNVENSGGNGPCFVGIDNRSKNVLVAHYGNGIATVLPVKEDGSLGKVSSSDQHTGSSVNKERQEGPHAHSIFLDAANKYAFSADLGLDKILIYKFNSRKGTITPNDPPFATVPPGSGPRHIAFHPNGKLVYVINEMTSTITGFHYHSDKGSMDQIETVSTLPAGFKGNSSTAEILIHPNGKFLYASNRGHDSITVYKIDKLTGKLAVVAHEPALVKTPRNFRIDPSGHFLLAAGQESDNVVVFKLNSTTGKLTPAGVSIELPNPVCIKFLMMKSSQ